MSDEHALIDLCFNCLFFKVNLFIFATIAFTMLDLSWQTQLGIELFDNQYVW